MKKSLESDDGEDFEELLEMSDDELDQKLEEFKGPISQFDEKTKEKLSSLLLKPEDEPYQPDSETYAHLYKLVGSPLPIIAYLCSTFIL